MAGESSAVFKRITDVLDRDPKALSLLHRMNEAARSCGFTLDQLDKAREMTLMAAILQNKEAFDILAEDVYNEIRAREGLECTSETDAK